MHPEFHDFTPPRAFSVVTPVGPNPRVRTDGMVAPERVSAHFDYGLTLGADQWVSAGVLLRGPELDDYTPYRVTCRFSARNAATVMLGFAPAPAVPSDAAVGTVLVNSVVVASGVGDIDVDTVLGIPNPGVIGAVDYTERATAFFLTVVGQPGLTDLTRLFGSLTVERMIGPMPRFYDRRIG